MKQLRRTYILITGASAVAAITVQSWVYGYLARHGTAVQHSFLINLLTAAGTYTAIYKLGVFLYQWKGWKIIHRQYLIEGKWYHELVSEAQAGYRRLGSTEVLQTFDSVSFNGQNYDPPPFVQGRHSQWSSRIAQIEEDGRVTVIYEVIRTGNRPHGNSIKEGLMYLQIDRDEHGRPFRLVGHYADSAPSKNRGAVTLLRAVPWAGAYEAFRHGDTAGSEADQPNVSES